MFSSDSAGLVFGGVWGLPTMLTTHTAEMLTVAWQRGREPPGSNSQEAVQQVLCTKVVTRKKPSMFELNNLVLQLRIHGSQIKVRSQRSPFSPWYKTFCFDRTEQVHYRMHTINPVLNIVRCSSHTSA